MKKAEIKKLWKCISGASVGLLAPLLLSGLIYAAPLKDAPDIKHLPNQSVEALSKVSVPFTFIVMGDNRSGTDVYAKLVKQIAADRPVFVVNVGDTVWLSGSVSEWNEFVDNSAPLTMPYFITPGNHDVRSKESEGEFKEFVRQPGNELYYSFKAGNSLFIVLDTEEPGNEARISGGQLAWLKETLAGAKERFKFVFMHRPMYPVKADHYGNCLDKNPKERDALQALFRDYGVDAVFAGHQHLYMRKEVDGVTHIITGGGGAPLHASEKRGGVNHYIKAEAGKDSVDFSVIGDDGSLKDAFTISKKAK